MKIAVTGAGGFVGSHVLGKLENIPAEVTALLRPGSSARLDSFSCNIIQFDLRSPPPNAFELLGSPDVLIHLAWGGLPNYKTLYHFESELPAQYQFLKMLIESGLKHLVVAGTCAEYGMTPGELSEDLVAQPCNAYGTAKNMLRIQLEYLKAVHQFSLTWARLFYLYGEGQIESALLPQLRQAVVRGDGVFNMSGGMQQRDFLHVSAVAEYLVELALLQTDYGVVNICSGHPISVREIVKGWIKENGWEIKLNFGYYPYPDYEPMAFWGSAKKLSSLIKAG